MRTRIPARQGSHPPCCGRLRRSLAASSLRKILDVLFKYTSGPFAPLPCQEAARSASLRVEGYLVVLVATLLVAGRVDARSPAPSTLEIHVERTTMLGSLRIHVVLGPEAATMDVEREEIDVLRDPGSPPATITHRCTLASTDREILGQRAAKAWDERSVLTDDCRVSEVVTDQPGYRVRLVKDGSSHEFTVCGPHLLADHGSLGSPDLAKSLDTSLGPPVGRYWSLLQPLETLAERCR